MTMLFPNFNPYDYIAWLPAFMLACSQSLRALDEFSKGLSCRTQDELGDLSQACARLWELDEGRCVW